MKTKLLVFLGILLLAASCGQQNSQTTQKANETVIFLVRHAEKLGGEDPDLSKAGYERAQELAKVLKAVELTIIYSSDFNRTRNTAQSVADDQEVEVVLYDPRKLEEIAEKVLAQHSQEQILIVGHSNTTPTLANLILDQEKYQSLEENIYNQLYKISISSDGKKECSIIEFGAPNPKKNMEE